MRVYGAPHAITGQMVVADVVWTAEADCRSTLKHLLRQTLERHKCPSRINVVAEIPHSERLKTLRRPEIALGTG